MMSSLFAFVDFFFFFADLRRGMASKRALLLSYA